MVMSSNGNISALLAICAGNSPVPGEFPRALMFTLICARINGWVNNRGADDLRRHRAHSDVIVMKISGNKMDSCNIYIRCLSLQRTKTCAQFVHNYPYVFVYVYTYAEWCIFMSKVICICRCLWIQFHFGLLDPCWRWWVDIPSVNEWATEMPGFDGCVLVAKVKDELPPFDSKLLRYDKEISKLNKREREKERGI